MQRLVQSRWKKNRKRLKTNSLTALPFESFRSIILNLFKDKRKHTFTHCKVYSLQVSDCVRIQIVTCRCKSVDKKRTEQMQTFFLFILSDCKNQINKYYSKSLFITNIKNVQIIYHQRSAQTHCHFKCRSRILIKHTCIKNNNFVNYYYYKNCFLFYIQQN